MTVWDKIIELTRLALSWPVVVLLAILLLRRPIAALIARVRRIELPGAKLETHSDDAKPKEHGFVTRPGVAGEAGATGEADKRRAEQKSSDQ